MGRTKHFPQMQFHSPSCKQVVYNLSLPSFFGVVCLFFCLSNLLLITQVRRKVAQQFDKLLSAWKPLRSPSSALPQLMPRAFAPAVTLHEPVGHSTAMGTSQQVPMPWLFAARTCKVTHTNVCPHTLVAAGVDQTILSPSPVTNF